MNYKRLIKILSLYLLVLGCSELLTAQVLAPKYEFRGVWVATVNNIDWPSKPGLSTADQQKEAIEMLDLYKKLGMNAVILQVRPCSDAFYDSPFEPWSRYLSGTPGRFPNPYYDPLTFWIHESHKRGMELHAWLNPYRVAQRADEPLAGNHQLFTNPEWVIRYDNKLFFDPGIPGTRDYVNKVVCDIVRRYEVDGIHMDDYFYPYPTSVPFPDEKSFALHNRAFPPTEKEGWRRENVDILIKTISDSIRSIKPWVRFGISPFGIWRNQRDDPAGSATTAGVTNYDHLYADIRKWLQFGWIDYVTPQIYFETGHKAADFETLCKWWNDNAFGRQLYIGLAPYKLDRNSSVQAWRSSRQLPTQLNIMRKYPNISGSVYFSGRQFKRDLFGFQDSLRNNYYRYPALIPPVRWEGMPLPPVPAQVQVSRRKVSWKTPLAETELVAPTRYMVYLCEPGKPFDPATASSIVQVTPLTKAELRKISRKRRTWEVRITSLDRYNNESPPSDPVKIKL